MGYFESSILIKEDILEKQCMDHLLVITLMQHTYNAHSGKYFRSKWQYSQITFQIKMIIHKLWHSYFIMGDWHPYHLKISQFINEIWKIQCNSWQYVVPSD